MEKAMAPHSSTSSWKIPWTEEPGGLPSMGLHRVGHDWSDLAAAAASISNQGKNKSKEHVDIKHFSKYDLIYLRWYLLSWSRIGPEKQ